MTFLQSDCGRVAIRELTDRDRDLVIADAHGVFDNPVVASLLDEFLEDSRHHMIVAELHRKLVGFVSGFDYIHPDKPVEFWINEVGVADAFRRMGIATALLRAMLEHAARLGCGEAWLLTEKRNVPAVGLYESMSADEHPDPALYVFPIVTK